MTSAGLELEGRWSELAETIDCGEIATVRASKIATQVQSRAELMFGDYNRSPVSSCTKSVGELIGGYNRSA